MRLNHCVLLACVIAAAVITAQTPQKSVFILPVDPTDILFVLAGGGENALALAHDDGVVLIDPLPVGWGKASLEAIHTVSDRSVKTIINIRDSEEHIKANMEYPTATRIIAHQNLVNRAKKMPAFAGAAAKFLPNEVVTDRLSLLDGLDRIDLYYFGPARTDADLVVVFPMKAAAYLGNLFPSKKVPVIEPGRGGSALAFPQTLAKVRALTGIRLVVPGHEPPRTRDLAANKPGSVMPLPDPPAWKQFEEYADFTRELVAAIVQAKQLGAESPKDAISKLTLADRFKAYDVRGAAAFAAAVYEESARH